ncbi:DNA packaging protein ATPase [Squirrelpox virus]|uniref:DNA packaging protein OPG160 n=2 Tax=Squirrelpox virus TaxID=240426 RepID=Q1HTR4_9POXV|nr:DNA packaging protein ATPase [Squirrelpox virus]ABD51472.1 O7L [Squirrelpox virus]CCD83304.1 DNA packaging protein ATPase [Squirrelpox virus]
MDRVQEKRFCRKSLLRAPFRIAMVGGSGSGKTAYLLSLLGTLVDGYRHVLLFTPVANPAYDGYIWPDHIQKVTTPEELEYALAATKSKIERFSAAPGRKGERFLIILDDMGDMQTRSRTLLGLMNYGRHINTSLILLCQTYKHVPVNGRASVTHFCCCNVSDSDVENMMRSMSIRGSKKQLMRAMGIIRSASAQRRVLIIEDSVFCEGEQRICYDSADEDVLARRLDPSVLIRQFSHMKRQLGHILTSGKAARAADAEAEEKKD